MASIRKRLLGTYLGVFAGLSLSLIVLILYTFNEREDQWHDELGARISGFAKRAAPDMTPGSLDTALDALDPARDFTLALVTAEGRIAYARSASSVADAPDRIHHCLRASSHGQKIPGCLVSPSNGMRQVVLSPDLPSDSANSALVRRSLALGLFLLWAATWIILLVSYRISAPLKRLAEQAEQLFRMVDDAPIDVPKTDDEVEALARVLEASRQQLRSQVFIDSLTGLYNRRYVMRQVGAEFERCSREHKICLVMVIDLDHFKQVNDTYGHEAGDRVLVAVSKILKNSVRPSDLVARFGGEEFVAVLPIASRRELGVVASRIIDAVRTTPIPLDEGRTLQVTISAGLASCMFAEKQNIDAHEAFQRLFKDADQALYQAKSEGRNRYVEAPARSDSPTFSATSIPSTPADMMPPA